MPDAQPDIILIVLDTLRRDHLSAYGYPRKTSPAFDEFAAQSTLFERAVAPAQWTIPVHASLFTGVYPTTHQLTEANQTLSGSYPTLAEILQASGYRTVGFCNNPLVGVLDNGLRRGFTEFYNYAGAAPNRPIDSRRNRVRRAQLRYWRQFARKVSQQFAESDWLFRVSLNPRLTPIWTRLINYKGDNPRSIDDFIDYLRGHHADPQRDPLFVYLNLMGAHLPYRPPEDYIKRFAPDDTAAHRFMRRFNADAARWASPDAPPLSDWERAIIQGYYDAEIAHQDAHLRRLLDYLQLSGALDNTMVIIMADHGEGHGDHGFFGHSFVVHQELTHVPLLIHYPQRFSQNQRRLDNVSSRRVFHTILDVAGIAPPLSVDDPNADVHGLSLANDAPEIPFSEAYPPAAFINTLKHRNPALIDDLRLNEVRRSVIMDDFKLIMTGNDASALYNIAADPTELQDISAQNATLVDALQAQIDVFVQSAINYQAGGAGFNAVTPKIEANLRALGYIE